MSEIPTPDNVVAMAYLNRGPYFDGLKFTDFYKKPLGVPLSFEIHQSINGLYRYGFILFNDQYGIRETLPLTGNEIITILYKNGIRGGLLEGEHNPTLIHFNVFNIEEVQMNSNTESRFTNKALKFHIIEAPFFLSYNKKTLSLAYGTPDSKLPIDSIITKHLREKVKLNEDFVSYSIDKMATNMHVICPTWKTQTFLHYLLNFCKDAEGHSNVKLYNTTDVENSKIVVNLKSLNSMFKNATKTQEFSVADFTNAFKPISEGGMTIQNINVILQYKFISYDITCIPTGFAGAYLNTFDYEKSQYFTLQNTYTNLINSNKFFYNFGLWSDTISETQSKQFYIGEQGRELCQTYLNNKIMDQKYQLRCETVTYVDEKLQVGDKIFIIFQSGYSDVTKDQGQLIDEQMTGGWIIEEIVDGYINGKAERKMVIIKDSYFNLYEKEKRQDKILPDTNPVMES